MQKRDSRERWDELSGLLDRCDRRGFDSLTVAEVKRLGRLYRQVSVDLSKARSRGADQRLLVHLNQLAARAHGRVYAARRVNLLPLAGFLTQGFPRLVRAHAGPLLIASGVFLASTLASFLAVVRSPDLAYSLFDENQVEHENLRLEKQEGEYRGNFTFTMEQSPFFAALIIGNNVRVAITAFALGMLAALPGVLLLVFNGRMLGTLTGMVWNRGYATDFYSLILTHGVIELTAICIAGGAGLMLGWALIAPGDLPRRDALRNVAPSAFGLLGGVVFLLIVAGMIEGYVTPHASAPVRWSTAAVSAILLIAYFGWAGRSNRTQPAAALEALTEVPAAQSRDNDSQAAA